MTMAAAAPYGWLLCQGQTLVNAAVNYPALWAAASPSYRVGGDLRLPDLRGRVPMGAGQGPSLTLRNIGDAVGSETVALIESQMPSHRHQGSTDGADRSLNHTHVTNFGIDPGENIDAPNNLNHLLFTGDSGIISSWVHNTAGADANLNHLHGFSTDFRGGGLGHPNVQPSAVVNFKVKV
jgi:microcystin-dependent protein